MQKGQVLIFLIVGILIIVVVGGFLFYINHSNNRTKPTSQNSVIPSEIPQTTLNPSNTPSPKPIRTDPTLIDSTFNTSTESSGWKKYSFILFSIKIPPDWSAEERYLNSYEYKLFDNYSKSNKFLTNDGGEFNSETDKGKLKVEIIQKNTDLSLDEYLKQNNLQIENKLKINNYDWIKAKSTFPIISDYYFKHPNKPIIYTFEFGLDFNNYQALQNQILQGITFYNP